MKVALLVGTLSLAMMSASSFANDSHVVMLPYANVKNVMISGTGHLGGCGVRLDIVPGETAYGCYNNQYISLSCDGRFNDKEAAKSMLDTIKEAAELEKKVRIHVDEMQIQNGACVAKRVDIQY